MTHNAERIGLVAVFTGGACRVMRPRVAILLCAAELAVFMPQSGASAAPDELLTSCEAILKAAPSGSAHTIEIPHAGERCWYYLSAMQNMSVLVDQRGQPLLGICAPPTTTLVNYVRIFVEYARLHPNAGKGNAAALAVAALNKAFPCGPGNSAKRGV